VERVVPNALPNSKAAMPPDFRLWMPTGSVKPWRLLTVEAPHTTCFAILRVRRCNVTAEREKTLTINEIYHSIQGESTWQDSPVCSYG
jgi:hypothetical protein